MLPAAALPITGAAACRRVAGAHPHHRPRPVPPRGRRRSARRTRKYLPPSQPIIAAGAGMASPHRSRRPLLVPRRPSASVRRLMAPQLRSGRIRSSPVQWSVPVRSAQPPAGDTASLRVCHPASRPAGSADEGFASQLFLVRGSEWTLMDQ